MLLPLDSPHWHDLTGCWSAPRAIELLRQIVSMGRLGEAWQELRDDITHQGSVYGVTSAALPHLIRLAPSLTPDEQRDLWIDERPHPHRRPHHRTGQILRALKLTRCGTYDISPE